ncbi:hypothetical protein GCM10027298_20100 [Epidermidibacterium keratini]
MPFLRRKREATPTDDHEVTTDEVTTEDDADAVDAADAGLDEDASDDSGTARIEDEAEAEDVDEDDADELSARDAEDGSIVELDDDLDDEDQDVDADDLDEDDEAPRKQRKGGLRGWLRAREKKTDYGPDYAVRVATLPDLEHFPEDGHVHPEIVRSWLALQQFGEAMLLVSWFKDRPAGYVMVSWTGDWEDAIRKRFKNVPSITNLWVDEEHAEAGVERKLLEAALTVIEKQGRDKALISVDRDDRPARKLYRELGFTDTKARTTDSYVYRDAEGKKRRGEHKNLVLIKDFTEVDEEDDDLDDDEAADEPQTDADEESETDADAESETDEPADDAVDRKS